MFPTTLTIFAIIAALSGHVSGMTVTVPESTVNVTVGGNATLLCTYTAAGALNSLFIQWSFYSAKEKQHQTKRTNTATPLEVTTVLFGDNVTADNGIVLTLIPWKSMELSLIDTAIPKISIWLINNQKIILCWNGDDFAFVVIPRCGNTVAAIAQKIYYFQNGQAYEYGAFKNRINGTTNQGNASITISNMQPSDTGLYTCEVFNPQDSSGQNQKSVTVNVLVKPSQPHCSLRGTPETGHLVSLSCYSEEGLPAPTYQWYRVLGDTIKPMTEQLNTKTGLFIIGNLTTFETGYYRCVSYNSLGNNSCEIDLTATHSEGGVIAGALIGAILGAVVICIIVWYLNKREKKKKRNEKTANSEMQPINQKQQANVEYVNIPNQENEHVAAAAPSREPNVANESSNAEEPAASGMSENDETQGVETQARA